MALNKVALCYTVCALILSLTVQINGAVITVMDLQLPRATPTASRAPPPYASVLTGVDRPTAVFVSAVGPAESGLTMYEIVQVQSYLAYYNDQTTTTVFPDPVTLTYTVVQGTGSVFREYADPAYETMPSGGSLYKDGMRFDCILDDTKKKGVCKGANLHIEVTTLGSGVDLTPSIVGTQTMPTTFTAVLVPVATIGTPSSGARSIPAASVLLLMGIFTVISLAVFPA